MLVSGSFLLSLRFPLVGASFFPAIFVFGDSLLDPGNADDLPTIVKADHPPYGRDFVTHQPTGRFCDGLLCSDLLAALAGLPYPPAYLRDPNDILQGTSFATAGARIMNLTLVYPLSLLRRVDFAQQVGYFSVVRSQLIATIGDQQASILLSKALIFICFGSNDFTLNYFGTRFQTSPAQDEMSDERINIRISIFEQNILTMYNLGARKFALASLSIIGCIPFELLVSGSVNGSCVSAINDEVRKFNAALLQLSERLQTSYSDAHFTYLDTYNIMSEIIGDPAAYGFVYSSQACCGTGQYGGLPCYNSQISFVCQDPSQYVFWDFAHPTQAVNEILANRFWAGSAPDVNPINVMQLASM